VLPGDDPQEPGYKPHRVELLGDGQQFVAYGIHPSTRAPYSWPDDDLLEREHGDLAAITEAQARAFIAEAELLFGAAGGQILEKERQRAIGAIDGDPGRPVRDLAEARQVIEILRSFPNEDVGYHLWVDVAYALKAALGSRAGWPLFDRWSATSPKYSPETTARTWRYAKPTRAGWRFLERIAADASR
jgi:putative DNA primase/helicase